MIHKVANVHEAIRLAEDLKGKGEQDWFRGQIQNWPLKSTYARLSEDDQKILMNKIGRFEHWIKSTVGLESIAANTDMLIAVAQHYGLPTNFVDFTTEPSVAGFFASHGVAANNSVSCILCLNTRELADFWDQFKKYRQGPGPEFIRLSVPNLWRLEAQHGVFLFCPFANLEHIYDLDRIVFPFTGPIDKPPQSLIYPQRKSHLEILLDQFFMTEEMLKNEQAMREINSFRIIQFPSRQRQYQPELVRNGLPPRLASWDQVKLALWNQVTSESFSAGQTSERLVLSIRFNNNPLEHMVSFNQQIRAHLTSAPSTRQTLLSWVMDDSSLQPEDSRQISAVLQRLWDGLRLLPYSNDQIAEGMACCAALALVWKKFRPEEREDMWRVICQQLFPDTMEIEFGSKDGSYSRAYVSQSAVLAAVRDDIEKFLNPRFTADLVHSATGLLQAIWAPDRLFEYDRLSNLFAIRIAPVQVWMRQGSAIFYSAARLNSLGLP